MNEIGQIMRAWERQRGQALALATVVRTRGSSYRRAGARMLIGADGTTVGSLSGGCLEEEVAARAQEVRRTGTPALLEFDTRRRFGCHGAIEIFIERLPDELLDQVRTHLVRRELCRVATTFADKSDAPGSRVLPRGEAPATGAFVQEIAPPLRLLIFGEGPDSAPLRSLGELLGWEMVEANTVAELHFVSDEWTAAVVKSHNYGRDCAALRELLPMRLRYVGLMGPRRRRDEILGDLLDSGVAVSSELFAPAGLDLGAETPAEIALAMVSEIQAVMCGGSGTPLRDSKSPIHAPRTIADEMAAEAVPLQETES